MKLGWFIPRSLSSQIALVMVAALLVASAVNFVFILGERSRAGLIEISGPATSRLIDVIGEVNENPTINASPTRSGGGAFRNARGGQYFVSADDPVGVRRLKRENTLEDRLAKALKDANISVLGVRAALSKFEPDPSRRRLPGEQQIRGFGPGGPDFGGGFGARPPGAGQFGPPPDGRGSPLQPSGNPRANASGSPQPADIFANAGAARRQRDQRMGFDGPGGPRRTILLSAQLPDNRWVSGEFFAPEPPQGEVLRLAASMFVLFACVLAAALWVANLLSRPLNDLKRAAATVGRAGEPEEVAVRGPSDVRQTLEAFNAMSRRVSQLLGEKDVMLGALGHDLRTPLSSLRIRLETMEPEVERQKAVRTIEETARLLEDILELARQGRSTELAQTMDLSILVEDMVEDYAETGAAVTMGFHERAPAACRAILFRRLLRNLIDNALKYGGSARASVRMIDGEIEVRVEDEGPGMSPEALVAATQPFVRGEVSRSRSTGGAGLGLALSDYIARNHGGRLILENRAPKGFSAAVRLPVAPAPAPSAS